VEPVLVEVRSRKAFAGAICDRTCAILNHALAFGERVSLVLPGGSTPHLFLNELGDSPLPWQRVDWVLSDERWVGVRSPESNAARVRAVLASTAARQACFFSLKTRHQTPSAGLEAVERQISRMAWPPAMTILGMGEDGHIASLFCQSDLARPGRLVASRSPAGPAQRISLGLSALTSSMRLLIAVRGSKKKKLIEKILRGQCRDLPVTRLRAEVGERLTFIAWA